MSVMYGEMNFYEKTMDICTLFKDNEPEPDVEKDTFFDCPMKEGLFIGFVCWQLI